MHIETVNLKTRMCDWGCFPYEPLVHYLSSGTSEVPEKTA